MATMGGTIKPYFLDQMDQSNSAKEESNDNGQEESTQSDVDEPMDAGIDE